MSNSNYKQISNVSSDVHFSRAMFGENQSSRMFASPVHLTTFNAGELVPIYCREILPDESLSMSVDFVIRQTTLLTPTMGNMRVDLYAFFVPNRVVNTSWKAVQGENYSGSWIANDVSLAPLVNNAIAVDSTIQIKVGSAADYYGFPTQAPIPVALLQKCHDLKFRGYVMIWNEFFRDQNYQPPIAISYLNVYQGFFDTGDTISLSNYLTDTSVSTADVGDGDFGPRAIVQALYGSGSPQGGFSVEPRARTKAGVNSSFYANGTLLRVNKIHDYFTSVLPSPQKGPAVFAPVSGSLPNIPVDTMSRSTTFSNVLPPLSWRDPKTGDVISDSNEHGLAFYGSSLHVTNSSNSAFDTAFANTSPVPANLGTRRTDINSLELSLDDIRTAAAIQQVYETLARGGSRYRSIISSFFGIDVEDPFSDVPVCLGHISRELDLFQTAQTSQSADTPQGNLAAFGYTSSDGKLFEHRFLEHGYLHIFAVVRHRNIYPSYFSRDNFRLNMLDFYTPPLANLSEQPVYTREINPFFNDVNSVFGYQEAWAEYRFEPDYVTGYMRPGLDGSLSVWNYADNVDPALTISDGTWLLSNSREVLDRTLAVTSSIAPQFKAQFRFNVDKTLPMPTYSVPGMDIL